MNDCPRIGKLFGGCKFKPRYDTVNATDPFTVFFGDGRGELRSSPARSTYICDVCERCGKTLVRRKSTGGREEDGAKNPASASGQ